MTKIKTTTKAKIDWLSDPVCGLRCLVCVRPSLAGTRPSRPSAYRYRATALWKANKAAKTLEMNNNDITVVSAAPM
jgi:hypothetical protein